MASIGQISVNQLQRLIGTPNCPTIIDVCIDEDFAADPRIIPGAFRHRFDQIDQLVSKLAGKKTVIACQKGLKLSQGAAAILRAESVDAEYLEGGMFAWRDANSLMIPAHVIPQSNEEGQTVWVTRHRPKVDRIACAWLIRRFVDTSARFLFVAPSQVLNVAEKFNATPFDVEDTFWSHRGGKCTFDTMIDEFKLENEPLLRLAEIVRGADTDQHDLALQVPGLLAISLGLSRMHKDDIRQLDAGMVVYDAFYRWARDATNESHAWPHTHGGRIADD